MLRRLWPLSLGAFALGLDAYVLAGLLPEMAKELHTSQARVGLGVAIFTAAYAVSAPLLASFASRYSTRFALLIGLLLFSTGNVVTMLAPSLSVLLIARLIAGVGAGLYSPVASSSAARMVDESQKGRALSLVLAGLSMGTALGVPVGLLIEHEFGWRWTIGLITSLGIIATISIICRRSDEFPFLPTIPWRERFASLRTRFPLLTLVVTLWTGVASLGLYTYIAEVCFERGFSPYVGGLIWLWGLGGMVGALLIGRILDKYLSPPRATLALLVSLGIGFLLFGYAPLPAAMVGCFIWGLSGWASVAPQQHALVTHSPEHSTSLIAWNSSINYLGSAIGVAIGSAALTTQLSAYWLPTGALLVVVIAAISHIVKMLTPPVYI
ncbi:TPA: MFS transporter [Enterobacter hormaechei subsp. steigerwaltii]|nr:MFS transporter [Enterobacter hormaechei subsp. steigerwaltii]